DIVYKIIGSHELQVHHFGGFLNAESQRLLICPDFYEINRDDFQIVVAEVVYNQQFGKLQHKDVLGALMNMGIKREVIGDIYDSSGLYFACTQQTFPFIQDELKQIKKSKIHLKIVDKIIEIEHQYITKTFIVSSLRLDKIVSTIFKVSRQSACDSIHAGNVKVNHKDVEEVSFLCHNNDIISFKRHGRVKLVDENRTTRQGNYVITGYFYK
ncbi:MAG: YlmH/Sll1252 family protein, partial [Coprobacillus sp.]